MVGEQFAVEHDTSNIYTTTVHCQEEVECCDSHGKTSLVLSTAEACHHSSLQDKADAASSYTEQHEWLSTELVHEGRADSVENDANGDPTTLKTELIFCSKTESRVKSRAIVVDDQHTC